MPTIDPLQLFLFLSGLVLAVLICLLYPILGLIAFMGIYLIKPFLVTRMPWLTGTVGFLVDMGTVFLAALSLLFYHVKIPAQQRRIAHFSVYFCLFFLAAWIWLRYPATRLPEYGIKKALIFSIFDVSVVLLGMYWARGLMETQKIIRSLFILGIIVSVGTVFFGRAISEYEASRISFAYSNPLAAADFGVYLIIVSICYWLRGHTARRAIIAIAFSGIGLGVIFITGSRGPIFILPIVILSVFFFYRRKVSMKLVIQVMLVLAILYGVVAIVRHQGVVQKRFASEAMQEGFRARVEMVRQTLGGWLGNPVLGTGPGDTSVQMEAGFERYPHNLPLEVLNEFGLIGFIPFIFLIFKALIGWRYLASEYLEATELKTFYVPIWACFFMSFLSSLKTGSYAGSNMFYFFMGASISLEMLCRQSWEEAFWLEQEIFGSPPNVEQVEYTDDYASASDV